MARPLRLESPGSVFHVVARGNDRIAVFRDDEDRESYLNRLAHYRERFGFRVLAWCLMSNHLHLAIRTGETPLSRIMAGLQSSYTQWFNRRHRRSGHLFQGRYKAFLVQDDRYLLSLVRYIHENPVAAGIAERPQQYPWSSDAAYRGRPAPSWLDANEVLRILGASRSTAIAQYGRMMSDDEAPRYEEVPAVAGVVKGDEGFADRMLAEREEGQSPRVVRGLTVERVLRGVAKELGLKVAEIASPGRRRDLTEARSVAAYLGKTLGGIPWSRMARRFGRDGSTLVRNVGRLEERMRENEGLRRKLKALERVISEGSNT